MSTLRPDAFPPSDLVCLSSFDPTPASGEDNSFLIRTVRQPDLVYLAEILASSFHSQEGWMRWLYPLLKVGIYEDLKSRMHTRTNHYACLVAVKPTLKGQASSELAGRLPPAVRGLMAGQAEALMGTVELSLKTPSLLHPWQQKYLYISNLAVKADCRRQGVALQLLQTCERIALDWGFANLYLHVLENNPQARRLYKRAGYRIQRIEVNPLNVLLGQPRQFFLHKRLHP